MRSARAIAVAAASAFAALTIAGCGSDSGTETTFAPEPEAPKSSPMAVPEDLQAEVAEFRQCLTDEGVDPGELPGAGHLVDPSPELRAALEACRHLLPEGAVRVPEPSFDGGG
jgi:hypothetical protein